MWMTNASPHAIVLHSVLWCAKLLWSYDLHRVVSLCSVLLWYAELVRSCVYVHLLPPECAGARPSAVPVVEALPYPFPNRKSNRSDCVVRSVLSMV